jgi:hypothetical protein
MWSDSDILQILPLLVPSIQQRTEGVSAHSFRMLVDPDAAHTEMASNPDFIDLTTLSASEDYIPERNNRTVDPDASGPDFIDLTLNANEDSIPEPMVMDPDTSDLDFIIDLTLSDY